MHLEAVSIVDTAVESRRNFISAIIPVEDLITNAVRTILIALERSICSVSSLESRTNAWRKFLVHLLFNLQTHFVQSAISTSTALINPCTIAKVAAADDVERELESTFNIVN